MGNIPVNDTLQFTVDALVNKTFPAKLSRKSGSINRETRTELWEYEYDNKNGEAEWVDVREGISTKDGKEIMSYCSFQISITGYRGIYFFLG